MITPALRGDKMGFMQDAYSNRLKNRLFSCLCEREADRDWESCLDGILLELEGIPEDQRGINYYSIWYKLSSARFLSYKYFRKNIFDAMALLGKGGEANELL